MSAKVAANKTIWILAEGMTEKAAAPHLKAFLDARTRGKSKVRLRVLRQDGGLRESALQGQARDALDDPSTVGVIALTDLHPAFKNAEEAKTVIAKWMPADPRCHVHVARHDFEAWLLVGWDALCKQAGVGSKKPWSGQPEAVNGGNPPAHRIAALFQSGKPPRKYKKPIDGKKLFEKLDLEQVATACPEFKAFLNRLLELAGYELLS